MRDAARFASCIASTRNSARSPCFGWITDETYIEPEQAQARFRARRGAGTGRGYALLFCVNYRRTEETHLGRSTRAAVPRLNAGKRLRWTGWRLGLHPVPDSDDASEQDDTHDSGPGHERAIAISEADLFQEAGLEGFDLGARAAQAGHLDQGGFAEPDDRSDGQVMELDSLHRDVLARIPRRHLVTEGCEKVE